VAGDANGVADVFVRDRATGITRRVSVNSNERQGNASSGLTSPSISADGRYVVFTSKATNLVRSDTNHRKDVFLRDRRTGTTQRISVSSREAQGNSRSGLGAPTITADGHYVVFTSQASNLVRHDTNGRVDVFVRNRKSGTTHRVSLGPDWAQTNGDSLTPTISADGRFVAFASVATNLVGRDTNQRSDVFVRDRLRKVTRRVSVTDAWVQGNNDSATPTISDDGRYVAFTSWATNLVRGDTNRRLDVFVRDRKAGTTRRASVSSAEVQARGNSLAPAISGNGRYLAFESAASNLVDNDTNNRRDVFLRDLVGGTTRHVSVSTGGAHGNGDSQLPAITRAGSFVVFMSTATNLVAGDANRATDVFLRFLAP
jgi:Tol biopolymer transport system component